MHAQRGKKVYVTLFLVFVRLPIYCVIVIVILKLPDPQADLLPIEPFLPVLFSHIFSVLFLILLFCSQKRA